MFVIYRDNRGESTEDLAEWTKGVVRLLKQKR